MCMRERGGGGNAVINHGASVDSSVVEAVWKMDSIYC